MPIPPVIWHLNCLRYKEKCEKIADYNASDLETNTWEKDDDYICKIADVCIF